MNTQKKILKKLLEKYYSSKSFTENSERAKPALSLNDINNLVKGEKEWEQYGGNNPSTNLPDFIDKINNILENMEKDGYVILKKDKKNPDLYSRIYLNKDSIPNICKYLGINSREDEEEKIKDVLKHYENNILLSDYVKDQYNIMAKHQVVKYAYVKGQLNISRLDNILKGVDAVLSQMKEIYIKTLSSKLYGDSKIMDSILEPICDIIIAYSKTEEYKNVEKSTDILPFFNIIKSPGYVYFKGYGSIKFINGEEYRLFGNMLGLLSTDLMYIRHIHINNKKVITVENLTTFYDENEDDFYVYLGGYHNTVRCTLLKKIYNDNPKLEYRHFGDIDSGGFYIFRRLKEQTQIPFIPYNMDIDSLKKNEQYWKILTANDRQRLTNILKEKDMELFHPTVSFMLDNNCKLEQEVFAL